MAKIKVLENQNVFDIAIQEYGQIESVFQVLQDNPDNKSKAVSLSDKLLPGTILKINTNDGNINLSVLNCFKKYNIQVTTGKDKGEGVGYWFIEQDNIVS